MRFYRTSKAARVAQTFVGGLIALYGLDVVLEDHRWQGLLFVFLAAMQLRSLWTQYWEIAPDGFLRSSGSGLKLVFPVDQLLYAGPVRGEHRFPISIKKDIELEIAGARQKRYVRIAERSTFLQQLQFLAPQAEIIAL